MSDQVIDFNRSWVRWSIAADPTDTRQPGHMPWGNCVRIQIDAACSITTTKTNTTTDFYLIAPCRKEWMYREKGLIMEPGGEYRVIFSLDQQHDVSMATIVGDRLLPTSTASFLALEFEIEYAEAERLTDDHEVVRASLGGNPITVRTHLADPDGDASAVLEYPVRTMNYHPDRSRFQVDTGPLIFADLESLSDTGDPALRLAHTVFNRFDYAEFVCRQNPETASSSAGVVTLNYADVIARNVVHDLFAIK